MEDITCSFSCTLTQFEGTRKETIADLMCFPLIEIEKKALIDTYVSNISPYEDDDGTYTISAELQYQHNGLYNQLTVNTCTASLAEDVEKLIENLIKRLRIELAVHAAIDSMDDNEATENGHPELSSGKYDPMHWIEKWE